MQCRIPLAPDGTPSRLYSGLQSKCGAGNSASAHLLANYIYAVYSATDVKNQMDAAVDAFGRPKYEKVHGEHKAADVYAFLNVSNLLTEQGKSLTTAQQDALGTDSSGNVIEYTSAAEALDKANTYNQTHKGHVAYVIKVGNKYNIVVDNKDSRSQVNEARVQESLTLWNTLKDRLSRVGVDISRIENTFSSANALQIQNMMQYLKSLAITRNDLLTKSDIVTLMILNESNSLVQQAITRYGTMENAAEEMYNCFHGTRRAGKAFFENIINTIKAAPNSTSVLDSIISDLSTESASFRATNTSQTVQEFIDDLHQQYGINNNYIDASINKVETLSQAMAKAAMTLERQIRFLRGQEGRTTQGMAIEKNLDQLLQELNSKHYCQGMTKFMADALNYARTLEATLRNRPTGTTLDDAVQCSKLLTQAKVFQSGYATIVETLANMDTNNLIIDENITESDRQQLRDLAKDVEKVLKIHKNLISEVRKDTMINLATSILGNEDYNGDAIANIVAMANGDSTMMDYLYAGSRVSNPMLAAMNTLIREAQRDREIELKFVGKRVREINDKLRKAEGTFGGIDTGFMFYKDPDRIDPNTNKAITGEYHIISEEGIDWAHYEKEKAKARYRFERSGLKGFALTEACEQWEEANTELKKVDDRVGHERWERIPSTPYRNSLLKSKFDKLSDAKKEYFREMMKLKGELGSLMPNYAQNQYRPVQVRNTFLDLIHEGIKRRLGAGEIARSILDRMKLFKIREDDEFFAKNGIIINGVNYGITASDYNNTVMRQIPIFYFNKLENQNNIMTDFSGSIMRLAGTAINYNAINSVKDVVETMADYIESDDYKIAEKIRGNSVMDIVEGGATIITNSIKSRISDSSNTKALAEGFVSRYIYGERTKDKNEKLVAFARNLILYNSLKGLALNVKGMVSNYLVGEYQMLIHAMGGTLGGLDYNFLDYVGAHAILFGRDGVIDKPGAIIDAITHNLNTKDGLIDEFFDPTVNNFNELSNSRYYSNAFRTLFGGFNIMGGYSIGEGLIHRTNMYAMLLHQKVYKNGKEISLYSALKKGNKKDGNSELVWDADITIDKAGTQPLTWEFLTDMKDKIRHVNQNCHGSMSEEDKGLIHCRMLGKFVMNFRQWMVEHYSRRYRGRHWDASTHSWEEGYWITTGKLLRDTIKGMRGIEMESAMKWSTMDARSKQNVYECLSEIALVALLFATDLMLGPVKNIGANDDEWTKWWKRFGLYQFKRLYLDAKGGTPWGAVKESRTLINSPIPSINTVNGLLYPIYGLPELVNGDVYKNGPYKGNMKYWVKVGKYSLPWWYQIEQLKRLDSEDAQFLIFDSGQSYR